MKTRTLPYELTSLEDVVNNNNDLPPLRSKDIEVARNLLLEANADATLNQRFLKDMSYFKSIFESLPVIPEIPNSPTEAVAQHYASLQNINDYHESLENDLLKSGLFTSGFPVNLKTTFKHMHRFSLLGSGYSYNLYLDEPKDSHPLLLPESLAVLHESQAFFMLKRLGLNSSSALALLPNRFNKTNIPNTLMKSLANLILYWDNGIDLVGLINEYKQAARNTLDADMYELHQSPEFRLTYQDLVYLGKAVTDLKDTNSGALHAAIHYRNNELTKRRSDQGRQATWEEFKNLDGKALLAKVYSRMNITSRVDKQLLSKLKAIDSTELDLDYLRSRGMKFNQHESNTSVHMMLHYAKLIKSWGHEVDGQMLETLLNGVVVPKMHSHVTLNFMQAALNPEEARKQLIEDGYNWGAQQALYLSALLKAALKVRNEDLQGIQDLITSHSNIEDRNHDNFDGNAASLHELIEAYKAAPQLHNEYPMLTILFRPYVQEEPHVREEVVGNIVVAFSSNERARSFSNSASQMFLDWGSNVLLDHNQENSDFKWHYRMQFMWHQNRNAAVKLRNKERFNTVWTVPLNELDVQVEGKLVKAVAITDARSLHEEGQAMRHCVSSYWHKCRDGASLIYSFRDDQNNRLSTVEFTRHRNKGKWGVSQHKAKLNASPDHYLHKAADSLVEALNK